MASQWFSTDTPVSSANKTDCHDITEIVTSVKSGIKHDNPTPSHFIQQGLK